MQRVSYLFDADDISGKSASNMKRRIKAEFNCNNALNERGGKSNVFVKELVTAGIVSERLTMPVLEYPPYETSQRPPDEIEMLEESGIWDKIAGAKKWEVGTIKCKGAVKLNLYTDGSLRNGAEGAYA